MEKQWQPKPSVPSAEAFVKECRTVSIDVDIMDMHGTFHLNNLKTLVEKFKIWREERIPGVRAFLSTYDKVGIAICKWLYQAVHDSRAAAAYDYIILLMVRCAFPLRDFDVNIPLL